jgi:hypothetical protein
MDIATRNSKIAEHLQKRFKERHGVELTRNRRLMLVNQIESGLAKFLSLTPNGKKLYRVMLYSNKTMANVNYSVLYCPQHRLILTVLPNKNSEEYVSFCKKNGLSVETVRSRELTAQERTAESVRKLIKHRQETEQIRRIQIGKDRLKEYHDTNNMVIHFPTLTKTLEDCLSS